MLPDHANVLVLVAHPDDETLWTGGTLLMQSGWTKFVGALCRADDEDRAPKFFRALELLGAEGAMTDLDDSTDQHPLEEGAVRAALLSLVPREHFDLVLTHAPRGEYTRHLRHEEVSHGVLRMWARGELQAQELRLFAYDDNNGRQWPVAHPDADIVVDLAGDIWAAKRDLLMRVYGFSAETWEVQTTPRREAFWRLLAPDDALAYLERGRRA